MATPDFNAFDDWSPKRPAPMAAPGNPNIGPDGLSADGRQLRSANMGPKTPPGWTPTGEPTTLRAGGLGRAVNTGSALFDAGASAGNAVKDAAGKVGSGLFDAGQGASRLALRAVKPALGVAGSVMGAIPHAAAYGDDTIPFWDKAKLAGSDALRAGGTAIGGMFGAGAGSVIPVAGTVLGGAAGGAAGDWAGHKAGNAIFGGDQILRDHGYDPDRSIIDSVTGKDGRSFTGGTPSAAAPAPNAAPNVQAPTARPDPNNPYAAANAAKLAAPQNPAQPDPSQVLRAPAAGQITKVGNSYSGSNVGAGAGMVDGTGKALDFGGGFMTSSGAAPNSTQAGATTANDNLIRAANLRDGVDVNRGTSLDTGSKVSIGADTGGFGILDKNYQRARSLRMDASSTKNNMETSAQHTARTGAAANALQEMEKEASDAPRMAAERNNQLRIAQSANDTQGRIASMHNTTALRGQDMTLAGHQMTVNQQANHNQLQLMAEQRKYDQERRQYKAGRDDKSFEQRQQATKNLHEEIGNMLPPGADGKPDLAKAATYAQGLTAHVAGAAKQYRDMAQKDPSNPKAKDWLDTAGHLDEKGVGALNVEDKQRLLAGMTARDVEADNHSTFNPFGGTAVNSNAPVTSLRLKPGLLANDYISTRSDGSQGVIPARKIDGGMFDPKDHRFDSLKVK